MGLNISNIHGPLARKRRKQQRGLCFLCNKPLAEDESRDHLIPLSKGGNKGWSNIVITHHACNLAKGDRMPTEREVHCFSQITGHYPGGMNMERLAKMRVAEDDSIA